MKAIKLVSFTLLAIIVPFNAFADTCPFQSQSKQPKWVNELSISSNIAGIGVEQYDAKRHPDIFSLRKQSEDRAKQNLSENLSSSIYNSILNDKKYSQTQLVKKAQSTIEQISEQSLSDIHVNERWLDPKNCLLWTQVTVETELVDEYIDEISNMKQEVNENIDISLKKSIVEALNQKQFYLNYDGFNKAVSHQSELTFQGITKPVLTWMIDNGFEMFEPSFVRSGIYISGMNNGYNTNSFEYYMVENKLTEPQMLYILNAYKESNQSAVKLVTNILHHDGNKAVYLEQSSGIRFVDGTAPTSRINAPFALGLRFTEDQPYWNFPKTTNKYRKNTGLITGGFSLLHLATLYKRADLVKLMLKEGFDPNFKDVNGMTPAQYAVAIEDEELIKLFLGSSKELEGVYAVAVEKVIYTSNRFFYATTMGPANLSVYFLLDGMTYDPTLLKKYKKQLKKKDKNNVKEYTALLKQSIVSLRAFNINYSSIYRSHAYPPKLRKEWSDKNIQRLIDLM